MKLMRIVLATLVLVTVTAAPAAAAGTTRPEPDRVSAGLCRLWPKLCT